MAARKKDVSKMVKALSDFISPDLTGEEPLSWTAMREEKKSETYDKKGDLPLVGMMDAANVGLVYPKNEVSYNLLRSIFRDSKDGWCRVPTIEYGKDGRAAKAKYSTDYLEVFLKVARAMACYQARITIGHDAPLTIEFKDDDDEYEFGFILAGRVSDGDDL